MTRQPTHDDSTRKERGVIFSASMVHALLAGTKTQTRRLDKKASDGSRCPYGVPGDRLWVKEAFKRRGEEIVWRADYPAEVGPWISPLFLKRKDTRIVLELIWTSHQPLHAISEADARAEGLPQGFPGTARDWFKSQWQLVHGPGSWDLNPQVWVLSFGPAC